MVANPLPTFWTKHLSLLWDKSVAIIKRYLFETEFATSTFIKSKPSSLEEFSRNVSEYRDIITIILITPPFLSYILRYKCVVVPPLFQYKSAYFYFVRMLTLPRLIHQPERTEQRTSSSGKIPRLI